MKKKSVCEVESVDLKIGRNITTPPKKKDNDSYLVLRTRALREGMLLRGERGRENKKEKQR